MNEIEPRPADEPLTATERVLLRVFIGAGIAAWIAIAWILNWIHELAVVVG